MKALAKQIAGRKKIVFDDPEAQKDYATMKALQKDLRMLQTQLDAVSKSAEVYSGDGKQALDTFESLGPKWQREGFDDVSRVVRGSVGLLRQSQSLNVQLEQEVESSVTRPLRELNENEFAKAKLVVKKTQELRAVHQDTVLTMERERKKGKVTALDAENQTKRAAADYEVAEADCKKAMRGAIESAQTYTITMACNYLKAYNNFWDQGAKMRELLAATAAKHRAVATDRAEKRKAEENRVIKVFGVALDEVVKRDGQVPQFVFDLITYLSSNGLAEEGIFRVPGNLEALNQWKKKIDSGVANSLMKEIGIHDAAGLLKLYMRELPTPLIPFAAYDEFVKVDVRHVDRGSMRQDDCAKRVEIMAILGRLPPHVYRLLKELVYMCTLIASKSSVNKMDASNLARSLAPGLMRSENSTGSVDMVAVLASSHASNDLLEHLIREYATYFERSLHAVAASGTVSAMKAMIALPSHGPEALGRDETGKTVLHYAAAKGRTDMCRYLVETFGEVVSVHDADSEGNTALHLAVMGGQLETAAYLVYKGASMDAMNKAGSSVWSLATLVSSDCANTIKEKAAGFAAGPKEDKPKEDKPKPKRISGYEESISVSPRVQAVPIVAPTAAAVPTAEPAVSPAVAPVAIVAPVPVPSSTVPKYLDMAAPPPPRPKGKIGPVVTDASSSDDVLGALQQAAPPVPRRGSTSFNSKGSTELTPEKALVMQARASIARALPERLSEVDPNQILWQNVTPEPFCEISPLTNAVLTFAALVCDANRAADSMAVRQSLKDVAKGLQTFFKGLDVLVKPFEQEDADAVRSVAGRLKECATQLLAVVRDISSNATDAENVSRSQHRLELQAYNLATVTLELFDVVELGRYRIVNMGMQKTAEEAAALTKASSPADVKQHRLELKNAAVALSSGVVSKALKLSEEALVSRQLKQTSELLVMVRDIRHPDASPAARAQLAKSIILSFRAVKGTFKEADETVATQPLSDAEVLNSMCADLLEIRAPDDYVAESAGERDVLEAVAGLHDVLLSKRASFGQWRLFAMHYEEISRRIAELADVARRILQRLREPEATAKVSFFCNALAFHQARITLVIAHACVVDHNTQPERHSSLQAVLYPSLAGPTRPGIAFGGLVALLLQFVPVLFKFSKQ